MFAMKKIIGLVLAFIMAFSFGINAFASIELFPKPVAPNSKTIIDISTMLEYSVILYASERGRYYIAMDDLPYEDIKISTFGVVSAEYVDFDPETMEVYGMNIKYGISFEGKQIEAPAMSYEEAKRYAKQLNEKNDTEGYEVVLLTNVNIIEVIVEDNYSDSFKLGTLEIEATLDGEIISNVYNVILDVTVFEYEAVKAAAANYDDGAFLSYGSVGYSDYYFYANGKEEPDQRDAAVVSTNAFRAIQGKNLRIDCYDMVVDLKNIKAGQKGINFKYYTNIDFTDYNGNYCYDEGEAKAIEFGFYDDQVILGEFFVEYYTGFDWFTLREAFGIILDEDDLVSYYILKDGVVVKEIVVDYMYADVYQPVVLQFRNSNSALGHYQIVTEAPQTYEVELNSREGENINIKYSKTHDKDFVIPEVIPTRKWHTFLGWAESENASEPEYLPGDIYSRNEDVTLYSVWQANEEAKAALSVSSATVAAGKKTTVKVELSEPADTQAIQFAIKYDAEIFDLLSCKSVLLPGATVNDLEDGIIYYVWDDVKSITEGGTLLEIEFEVAEGIEPQKTGIEIVENRDICELIFADSTSKEFRVETENGIINVVNAVYGDVDGNGIINVFDAYFIRKNSARLMDFTDEQMIAADVDGNGTVNILDANLVRRYVVKLIDKFPVD